jgi:TPR repeat protein
LDSKLANINASMVALEDALACDDKPAILTQLRNLAELGQPQSFATIADLYEFGTERVAPRLDLAFEWFRRSAYEEIDYEGYFGLARFYRDGKHVERDLIRSDELFLDAFNMGSSEAAIVLGLNHLNGFGVDKNLDGAEKYLSTAAKSGYVAAYYFLAKVELARRHYFRALKLWWTCIYQTRKLMLQDPKSAKLFYLHGAP